MYFALAFAGFLPCFFLKLAPPTLPHPQGLGASYPVESSKHDIESWLLSLTYLGKQWPNVALGWEGQDKGTPVAQTGGSELKRITKNFVNWK